MQLLNKCVSWVCRAGKECVCFILFTYLWKTDALLSLPRLCPESPTSTSAVEICRHFNCVQVNTESHCREVCFFWIFHHCSKSMNSDLTADTEEIPLGTCYRDTGGTCRFFSCATSRGEARDGGVIKKDQIRSQMMARIARSYQDQEWVAILWRTDMI